MCSGDPGMGWAVGKCSPVLRPDPILAVDEPGRRGYLVDDVYLAVAWVAVGGDELIRALQDRGIELKTQASATSSHDEFLLMVMRSGSPVPSSGPS